MPKGNLVPTKNWTARAWAFLSNLDDKLARKPEPRRMGLADKLKGQGFGAKKAAQAMCLTEEGYAGADKCLADPGEVKVPQPKSGKVRATEFPTRVETSAEAKARRAQERAEKASRKVAKKAKAEQKAAPAKKPAAKKAKAAAPAKKPAAKKAAPKPKKEAPVAKKKPPTPAAKKAAPASTKGKKLSPEMQQAGDLLENIMGKMVERRAEQMRQAAA